MKFQNCILINFVTDAWTDAHRHGQAKSNMHLQLKLHTGKCDIDNIAESYRN